MFDPPSSSCSPDLKLLADVGGVDLVLTDLVMPGGLSGLDLAERIREADPDAASS